MPNHVTSLNQTKSLRQVLLFSGNWVIKLMTPATALDQRVLRRGPISIRSAD